LGFEREKIVLNRASPAVLLRCLFSVSRERAFVMNKVERTLKSIANGAEEARFRFDLDLESVLRLMAACSAASSLLKKLEVWSCGLDAEATELIASSLRSNIVLAWLDFLGNKDIGPRGAQALAEMLCVNAALKVLNLNRCGILDEGAGHLAVALRHNRTLEQLFFDSNGVTHFGASDIAAALPFNQTLKRLSLNHNPLGGHGVEALAKAVRHSGLHELWLTRTKVGERGCAALVEMLKNGSRLQELRTHSDHWPALEEGFRCNGWLLKELPKQFIERNKAMHKQAKKSVYTLLLIRKLRRTALSSFPKEVVRDIAAGIYSNRGEVSV
jgi:Ran GTPase-activating protein (RanGAP) involved in mRNA processing and transport